MYFEKQNKNDQIYLPIQTYFFKNERHFGLRYSTIEAANLIDNDMILGRKLSISDYIVYLDQGK